MPIPANLRYGASLLAKSFGYGRLLLNSLLLSSHYDGSCITLRGAYGASDNGNDRNIGDNAILLSMLERFSELSKPLLIGVIDGEGKYEIWGKEYNCNTSLANYEEWITVLKDTQVLVIGGGGLFQDYGVSWKAPTKIFLFILPFWLAKRKICWFSVGVGPLTSKLGRISTVLSAFMTDFITLRDIESRSLLIALGVPPSKLRVSADPVLSYAAPYVKAKKEPNTFALALAPFFKTVYREQNLHEKFTSESILLANSLASSGYYVRLFSFRSGTDYDFNRKIYEGCIDKKRIEIVGNHMATNKFIREYSRSSYAICMRYHSVIFSVLTKTPFVSITYHPKVSSFVDNYQLFDYAVEAKEFRASLVMKKVCQLQSDPEFPAKLSLIAKTASDSSQLAYIYFQQYLKQLNENPT